MSNSKSRRGLNIELITAISAIAIGVAALGFSFYEARLMRVQQEASLFPYIDIGAHYNSEGFEITAENKGNGLAFIESVKVSKDGYYFENWQEVIDSIAPPEYRIGYDVYGINQLNQKVMAPREEVSIFNVPWTDVTRVLILEYFYDLNFEVIYCSMLDDCWRVTQFDKKPLKGKYEIDPETDFNR
ncbi:MAG: hypothetical protein AAFO07_18595 [Bacteroidota bacterium]